MAQKRFDQLTAASSLADTDILPVETDPSGTKVHKKATIALLAEKMAESLPSGSTLIGASQPLGSVAASPGATYFATSNASFWIKQTGTGTDGWVCLIAGG